MTNETGKPIAPTDALKAPQVREIKDMRAEKPNARWPARFLAVVGMGTLAACGGEGATTELPPTNLPGGVCANIAARISEEGNVRLGLDEAKLALGKTAYLTDDALVKVSAMTDTLSGTKATLELVDEDGNSLANILDPTDGSTIPATSDALSPGDSWTFVIDGVSHTVTVCAIMHTEDGDYVILSADPGYDWCAPVDRVVPETEDYASGYGNQHITRDVRETGEEDRNREDAACNPLVPDVLSETTTLELGMLPGNQPAVDPVKVLGEELTVISLSNYGYILLGKRMVSGEVEVGETLIGTGINVLVNEVSRYGDVYEADISINVDGISFEVIEGARAGDVFKVTNSEGKDLYVRVIRVTSDGKVELEVLENSVKLQDGGTYTDKNGKVWDVELTMPTGSVSGGVRGWHLVKQE